MAISSSVWASALEATVKNSPTRSSVKPTIGGQAVVISSFDVSLPFSTATSLNNEMLLYNVSLGPAYILNSSEYFPAKVGVLTFPPPPIMIGMSCRVAGSTGNCSSW